MLNKLYNRKHKQHVISDKLQTKLSCRKHTHTHTHARTKNGLLHKNAMPSIKVQNDKRSINEAQNVNKLRI